MISSHKDILDNSASGELDALVDDVARRAQKGEKLELEEYLRNYPHLASELTDIWPALMMVGCLSPIAATTPDLGEAKPFQPFEVPRRLGDFQLLREIGRGGMGIVFAARQLSLDRPVALKVLDPRLATDPKLQARFLREAQSAAKLQHPNIVSVFGNGQEGEISFYSMQLIDGEGLNRVIQRLSRIRGAASPGGEGSTNMLLQNSTNQSNKNGAAGRDCDLRIKINESPSIHNPVPTAKNLDLTMPVSQGQSPDSNRDLWGNRAGIASQNLASPPWSLAGDSSRNYWHNLAAIFQRAAEAVDHAHRQGIVHRDIKPSNLLLDCSGTIWITDFGLAKLQTESDLTRTGDILGTLKYISPEQLSGESAPSCDIYGLGATLYEILTLQPAILGDDKFLLLHQIRNCEPKAPRAIDPAIPADLETITLKAMAKRPGDRYLSAGELASDLNRYLLGQPIQARPVSRMERTRRWAARNPWLAGLSFAIVLGLIVAAIGAAFAVVRFRDLASRETASRHQAGREKAAADSAQLETRWKSYVTDTNRGIFAGSLPGGSNLQSEILGRWSAPEDGHDFRGWEFHLLASLANKAIGQIETGTKILGAAWHPSEATVLWVEEKRLVYYDTRDRSVIWQANFEPWGRAFPEFNGTGKLFSVVDAMQTIQVWDLESKSKRFEIHPENDVYSVCWSRDSQYVGFFECGPNNEESRFVVCDGANGKELKRLANPANTMAVRCNFSPDSNWLAMRHWPEMKPGAQGIAIWNTKSWQLEKIIPTPQETITAIVWSPEGNRLASTSLEGNVHVWNFNTGTLLASSIQARPILDLAWSPNGEFLATASENSHVAVYRAADLSATLEPLNHRSAVSTVAFSPDSERLLTASLDGTISIWASNTDPVNHSYQLKDQLDSLQPDVLVSWHPNSRMVAAGQAFPTSIFDNETEECSQSILGSYGKWNHNGELFATKYCDPVSIWDAKGKSVIQERADLGEGLLRDWHPKEDKLAGLCNEQEFWIWDIAPNTVGRFALQSLTGERQTGSCLSWNHSGTQIAIGTESGHMLIFDANTGKLTYDWNLGTASINSVAWDPADEFVAVGSNQNSIPIVSVQTGSVRQRLNGHANQVLSLSWSFDGQRIASGSADRQVLIWDVGRAESVLAFALSEEVRSVAWSPNNKALAALTQDGVVRIWNAAIGYKRFE